MIITERQGFGIVPYARAVNQSFLRAFILLATNGSLSSFSRALLISQPPTFCGTNVIVLSMRYMTGVLEYARIAATGRLAVYMIAAVGIMRDCASHGQESFDIPADQETMGVQTGQT